MMISIIEKDKADQGKWIGVLGKRANLNIKVECPPLANAIISLNDNSTWKLTIVKKKHHKIRFS